MEPTGFEPVASWLPVKRSPNWATAPLYYKTKELYNKKMESQEEKIDEPMDSFLSEDLSLEKFFKSIRSK